MVVWHMVGGVEFGTIEGEEIGNGNNVVRFRRVFPGYQWIVALCGLDVANGD
jgi:hypothetical protein